MSIVRIASRAGVSIATVSRVINNSQRVNPRLAEQVHRALADLQINPNKIRRNKGVRRTGKSGETSLANIAIISVGQDYRGWFQVPVIASVVAEIMRVADERQIGVHVSGVPDGGDVSALGKRQPIDGALLFLASGFDAETPRLLAEKMPVVALMGGPIAPLSFDHVGPDNAAVGVIACDYLLKHGCGTLAFLTSQPGWGLSKLRAQGFAATACASGRQPHAFIEGEIGNFDCVYGRQLIAAPDTATLATRVVTFVRDERRADPRPVGLFVSRDEELASLHRLLIERGVTPGKDIVLVSCDNEVVRLSALHPRPASVELNAGEVARHAVERLTERARNPQQPPVRVLVTPTLRAAVY